MTKIKNTKKGMAKKTLSMSLVVAMIATSNVPVWAAEFSDGSDVAVETEAPVAEDTTDAFSDDVAEAPVADDTDTVTQVATATEAPTLELANWKDSLKVKNDIKDGDTVVTGFDYKVRIDGHEVVDTATGEAHNGGTYTGSSISDLTALNNALKNAKFAPSDAGKTVSVEITKDDFKMTIPGIKIETVNIEDVAKLDITTATKPVYTGKQTAFADDEITNNFAIKEKNGTNTYSGLDSSNFTYTYEGDDLVNVSDKDIYVVANVNAAGYTGKIKAPFRIQKRPLVAGELELKLNKNTISYAELGTIPSDFVTVKDTETGETLPTSVYTLSAANNKLSSVETGSNEDNLRVTINNGTLLKDKIISNNYSANSNVTKDTTDKVKVVANNMSDFKIVVDGIGKDDATSTNAGVKDNAVRNAIHFYIGETEVTNKVKNILTYKAATLADGATTLSVEITGDNKNVLGNTTVSLPVTTNKLVDSKLTFEIGSTRYVKNPTSGSTDKAFGTSSSLGNEKYTGEAVTKAIKNVKSDGTNLVADKDYKIVYENDNINTNAVSGKTVKVSIVGINDWSGSIVIGTYNITPAEINAADIKVPKKVLYDGNLQTAADYMTGKVTVKATTSVNGEEKKIDVPADAYQLTCIATKLAVGGVITTKIARANIKNKNFTIAGTGADVIASDTTTITNKDLSDENVKLEVIGSYTYTGEKIVPTVKVSVDGVELAKDIDYKIKSCTNNENAGEATVTVEGTGDYSGTQTAKFTINKANLSDLKVEAKKGHEASFTYTGTQVKPTTSDFKITLNGVELKASDFAITYPTTSKVNVNVGDATVALAPVKDNKNFTGDKKDVTFKILPKEIDTSKFAGAFYAFDENGDKIDFTKTAQNIFAYDGTEKTFKDIKFVPTKNDLKLVEGKDYEIKYFNNVTGPTASVYINGIGNYTNTSTRKFSGSEETYTVKQDFYIEGVTIGGKNVSISDTEYAGGVAVTPNVTIKVGERTLVEGTDYEFKDLINNVDVTAANKVLSATLKLKGAYTFNNVGWSGAFTRKNDKELTVKWKIVKKDIANTAVEISETNGKLTTTVLNGNVIVPATEYDVKDNGDGTATVTAKADSKSYTGSQKVSVKKSENVGAPVISNVKVTGNNATVVLSDEAEGASGYDYVISTSKDPSDRDARIDVVKNQVQTTANFKYVPQGTYYAYCHAWTRDENGMKVFGGWSNSYAFSVTAITPDTPEILSVQTKGSTITVTYKESANSTGYDVVLGKGSKQEHGETRPYQYGTYKKLNVKPGVCKAVFTNIPAGTYYAGVHSWNRTASENDNKVFSKWSNLRKATVK